MTAGRREIQKKAADDTLKSVGVGCIIYLFVSSLLVSVSRSVFIRLARMSLCPLILAGYLSACASGISSPYVVNLTLSPSAHVELRNSAERVKVAAYYYWRPNSGGPSHNDDELGSVLGGYSLGEESHEVERNTSRVSFAGRTRANFRIRAGHGEARVLINVFSARRTRPNNILDCSVFDDTLAVASSQGINVNCSLIGEHR